MQPGPAQASSVTTIVVDTAEDNGFPCDTGDCSIRGAIALANFDLGPETITFDPAVFPPGGGAPTIVLSGTLPALPAIDAGVGITIDGSGADVRISGASLVSTATGFSFYSAPGTPAVNITVRNIELFDFAPAISVCGGGGPCQAGVTNVDFEGVTATEESVLIRGSAISGVSVRDLVIPTGGTASGLRVAGEDISDVLIEDLSVPRIHVIGNTSVSDTLIANNFLTLPDGAFNEVIVAGGVSVSDLTITGNASNAANENGIQLYAPGQERINISGNIVTNATLSGIAIEGEGGSASDVTISDNAISAPGTSGISLGIQGPIDDLDIAENSITSAVSFGMFVRFHHGANNVIHDNTVFNNGSDGIHVRSWTAAPDTRVRISHNEIFDNGGIGINLHKPSEVTPITLNDAGDVDTGPNDLLNFPVITGDMFQMVTGSACAGCTVELFHADADASGYGEGNLWLKDATADGTGQFSIPICGEGLTPGDKVTATTTDALGNTSEFSLNYTLIFGSGSCLTPTPSLNPSLTPTLTPQKQGDLDCSGLINLSDALAALLYSAGIGFLADVPCETLGAGSPPFGSVTCGEFLDLPDVLALLQYVGNIPLNPPQPVGCTPIGELLPD